MAKVRYHKFNGVKYEMDLYRPRDGQCDPPSGRVPPTIALANGLHYTKRDLVVLIHEMLHASVWDMKEEVVERTAEDIGGCLTRLGLVWKQNQGEFTKRK